MDVCVDCGGKYEDEDVCPRCGTGLVPDDDNLVYFLQNDRD